MKEDGFTISIIGLGLMGASLARALRGFRDAKLVGFDLNAGVMAKARGGLCETANSAEDAILAADLAILCTWPETVISDIRRYGRLFRPGSVVTEICGVKGEVAACCRESLPEGVGYVGLHPMAGKESGGFDNADPEIFAGAGFIITAPENCGKNAIALIEDMCRYIGAGQICRNTPEEHDLIIGYTSALTHISASALCMDYPPGITKAHMGGAFRDCTRVAASDPALWADLLIRNSDGARFHLERYIDALSDIKNALERGDKEALLEYLRRSNSNKKEFLSL